MSRSKKRNSHARKSGPVPFENGESAQFNHFFACAIISYCISFGRIIAECLEPSNLPGDELSKIRQRPDDQP